jgi:hypothetical protein
MKRTIAIALSQLILAGSLIAEAPYCPERQTLQICRLSAVKKLFAESGHVHVDYRRGDNIYLSWCASATEAHLAILQRAQGSWRVRYFCDDSVWGKGWEAVRNLPGDSNELLAVVDHVVEGPGAELILLYSSDGGEHWELRGCLKKPHYFALLETFEVSSKNDASIVMFLDDSPTPELPAGFYQSQTNDGGRTWSDPVLQLAGGERKRTTSAVAYTEKELLKLVGGY